jgi:hypothetical protein
MRRQKGNPVPRGIIDWLLERKLDYRNLMGDAGWSFLVLF